MSVSVDVRVAVGSGDCVRGLEAVGGGEIVAEMVGLSESDGVGTGVTMMEIVFVSVKLRVRPVGVTGAVCVEE